MKSLEGKSTKIVWRRTRGRHTILERKWK